MLATTLFTNYAINILTFELFISSFSFSCHVDKNSKPKLKYASFERISVEPLLLRMLILYHTYAYIGLFSIIIGSGKTFFYDKYQVDNTKLITKKTNLFPIIFYYYRFISSWVQQYIKYLGIQECTWLVYPLNYTLLFILFIVWILAKWSKRTQKHFYRKTRVCYIYIPFTYHFIIYMPF